MAAAAFLRKLALLAVFVAATSGVPAATAAAAAGKPSDDTNPATIKLHRICNDPVVSSPDDAAAQIDAGADINFRHPTTGQTPLMTSVLSGKPTLVKLLLERGADVTIPEKDGYTPAHGAGFQGRAEIMEMLHVHGIDVVNDVHSDGFTPLHRACWGSEPRHTDTVRFLIDGAGADPARKGAKDGRSPMQMTRNPGTTELLKNRIDAALGADL